ncbi:MAG: chemotaxis protein CheW [Mycobacterium leprae]
MQQQEKRETITQVVVFRLGNELYGADIAMVPSVTPVQRVTRVPRTPPYIVGVTNLRGRVIPVVDLRACLGLPLTASTKATRIAVAELDGGQVGMIVDSVQEVLRISSENIEPPSPMMSKVEAEYVLGVAKADDRLIILLDLARVLARDDRKVV